MLQPELFVNQQDFGRTCSGSSEPLFWIKELRFLEKLSPAPDAEVRRVEFHKGLNIVWAESTQKELVNAKQRIAGHATGKTTLCRFIRYILGEKHYADGSVADAIYMAFHDGYIVAEVYLAGAQWVVARPVGLHAEKCRRGCSIDAFLAEPEISEQYAVYVNELGKLRQHMTSISQLPDGSDLGFWHVLPWMTRDQDCSFAGLNAWRNNAVSFSDSPSLSKEKSMLVVRSILAAEVASEIVLVKQQEALSVERKQIEGNQHDKGVLLMAFREALKPLAEAKSCSLELVDGSLDQFKEALQSIVDGDGVTEEEEAHLSLLEAACERLEGECAVLKSEIEGSNGAYMQTLNKINELRKPALRHAEESERQEAAREHPGRKYCCMPIDVARQECPIFRETKPDIESQKNLFDATDTTLLEQLERSAKIHAEHLKRERTQWDTLKMDLADAVAKRNDWKNELRIKRHTHSRQAVINGMSLEIIKQYKDAQKSLASLLTSHLECQRMHKSCSDSLSEARKRSEDNFKRFGQIFDQLIGFVLGTDVHGKVMFNGGIVDVSCSYQGVLTSAAIRSVQTVCFDLAALVLSVEGGGTHPRFLLHDSPRVADLSVDIFHRYFLLARELEVLSDNSPNFQYIITTTEPPPNELIADHAPWLVCKLDARTAEHRLLKRNL